MQESLIKMSLAETYINNLYPYSFHQLENLVLSQKDLYTPPVISKQEFRQWAESCGITTNEEFDSACKLLNELGVVIHFNDARSALDDMVILDPQWLTKLMATLITTKPNFVKGGVIPHTQLG